MEVQNAVRRIEHPARSADLVSVHGAVRNVDVDGIDVGLDCALGIQPDYGISPRRCPDVLSISQTC